MSNQNSGIPSILRLRFILILLLIVGLGFLTMISNFLIALVLAAVFAGLLHPTFAWLCARLGDRPIIAALVTLTVTLLALVLPLAGLVGVVAAEAMEISKQLQPWVKELMSNDALFIGSLPEVLNPYRTSILNKLAEAGSSAGSWMVSSVSTVTQGTLDFFIGFFVMLYAMFYFLIDGPHWVNALKNYLPLSPEDRDLVVDRGLAVTRGSLKGVVLIGALQGLLVGVGFWACGLSGSAFWGTIVFGLSAIPGLGAPIIWMPAAIYLGIKGDIGWSISLVVWGVVVVGLVDNVLRPIIVGRDAKLPDLVVLISILGGISVFGVMGIVVGPIVAAMLDTVLNIYRRAFALWLPDEKIQLCSKMHDEG